ncbi:hypothetical protein UlMin_014023 [Ulmus minor]
MCEALDNLGMIYIPSIGFYYTWSNCRFGRQQVNSRIDRGVANEEWSSRFPDATLQLLPQTTSDHHPQLLSCFGHNVFAKRQFRFEAAWVEDWRSYWVVNHSWALRTHPRPPTRLLNRAALSLVQQNLDSPYSVDYDRNLRQHLEHLLKMEETLWFQKSRLKWQLEGDRCTRFFFLTTLTRRKFNRIDQIKGDDGQWLTSRDQIGRAFLQCFLATYDEQSPSTIKLNHLISPVISEVDNTSLISTLHLHINSTNIVLVPKSKNPSSINHFRPIAVCNVIYKVISKLLADRLKPLLSRLICPTQGAFVPGRSIHDNSVII